MTNGRTMMLLFSAMLVVGLVCGLIGIGCGHMVGTMFHGPDDEPCND